MHEVGDVTKTDSDFSSNTNTLKQWFCRVRRNLHNKGKTKLRFILKIEEKYVANFTNNSKEH